MITAAFGAGGIFAGPEGGGEVGAGSNWACSEFPIYPSGITISSVAITDKTAIVFELFNAIHKKVNTQEFKDYLILS